MYNFEISGGNPHLRGREGTEWEGRRGLKTKEERGGWAE